MDSHFFSGKIKIVFIMWLSSIWIAATGLSAMCAFEVSLGSLDNADVDICGMDELRLSDLYDPAGQVIGGDAVRRYILSDDPVISSESIIYENENGIFPFDSNELNYGQAYYAFVVISELLNDMIDLESDCFVSTAGKQIRWFESIDDNVQLVALGTQLNCDTPAILLSLDNWDGDGMVRWTRDGGVVAEDVPSLQVNQQGTYMVSLSREGGLCAEERVITISEDLERPMVQIGPVDTITCRNPLVQAVATVEPQNRTYSYLWEGPGVEGDSSRSQATLSTSGRHTLTVTDLDSRCFVVVEIFPPEGRVGSVAMGMALDSLDCDGDPPIQLVSRGSTPLSEEFSHFWLFTNEDGVEETLALDSVITVTRPGTYTLLIQHERSGCQERTEVIAPLRANITDVQVDVDEPTCAGYQDARLRITSVTGGRGPFSYSFDGGETFGGALILSELAAGTYSVVVMDSELCTLQQEVTITDPQSDFFIDLGEDQFLAFDDSVIVAANTNLPSDRIREVRWSPAGILDTLALTQSFTLDQGQTNVRAVLVDSNGCRWMDDVLVTVDPELGWYLPGAVRPSSPSEANQTTQIFADPARIEVQSWSIYDRWGRRVYQRTAYEPSLSLQPDFAWNGLDDGEELLGGSYVYHLTLRWRDGRTTSHTGSIMVLP